MERLRDFSHYCHNCKKIFTFSVVLERAIWHIWQPMWCSQGSVLRFSRCFCPIYNGSKRFKNIHIVFFSFFKLIFHPSCAGIFLFLVERPSISLILDSSSKMEILSASRFLFLTYIGRTIVSSSTGETAPWITYRHFASCGWLDRNAPSKVRVIWGGDMAARFRAGEVENWESDLQKGVKW